MHTLLTFEEAKRILDKNKEAKGQEYYDEFTEAFDKEYNQLENNSIFFYGCSFKNYSKNYTFRLNEFKNSYTDSLEIDFILKDYKVLKSNKLEKFISENLFFQKEKINFSIKKVINHLEEKALQLGYYFERETLTISYGDESQYSYGDFIYQKDENYKVNTENSEYLEWSASKTDFIELFKALIESKAIKGTQKDIIEKAGEFFRIDTKNYNQTIQDIGKRNNGSETKFITKLNSALLNHYKEK